MSWLTGTNVELIYASTSVGASLNTFTTEALLNTVATMGVQPHLPPDFWQPNQNAVGRGIKIVARGTLASTATPTYTVTIRGGAAANASAAPVLAGTGAVATISGATTSAWELEVDCILKTMAGTGTNSTIFSVGRLDSNGLSGTANTSVAGGLTTAGTLVAPGTITTLDTSVANYINVTVACSASNAANVFALQSLMVYGLN